MKSTIYCGYVDTCIRECYTSVICRFDRSIPTVLKRYVVWERDTFCLAGHLLDCSEFWIIVENVCNI